ncbi:hypothetical protein EM308_02315 [Flavobacterium gilvum]|uniref:Uncharacterized protein n=1 Tax=Flavobacterium gilvum TaxID=1492737 RepID=A0AAC9N3A2_9FLAO|nr:hypothetical protein EM308_02315 [Flavobacterium gilvum]
MLCFFNQIPTLIALFAINLQIIKNQTKGHKITLRRNSKSNKERLFFAENNELKFNRVVKSFGHRIK